jgi:hypothetical protein
MLLLAALAAGCGSKQPSAVVNWQLTDPTDEYPAQPEQTTDPWDIFTVEQESSDAPDAPTTEPGVITSIVYIYPTQAGATTTKAPAPGTNPPATAARTTTTAARTASTARTNPTTRTTATTRSTTNTTRTTTTVSTSSKHFSSPISIGSKEAALSAFNSAVKKVIDSRAGFNKSHMITYKDWVYDPALLEGLGIPGLGAWGDPSTYLTGALNTALNRGVHSATAHKGDANQLIKNPTWTMADLKDVTYSGKQGGDWTITVTVKDGFTRQEKRLFGNGTSGDSPIDRGPLYMATGDANLYDHMRADQVFTLLKNITALNVDPIDISETTSQVKFVAVLDGGGSFVSLSASYNQQLNLAEIKMLNGMQSYKNNVGSSSVTVTYDVFDY